MSLLAARSITKQFGSFTAVDSVDLDIEPGEIVGLLGANGAGKTTLIKIALGLLDPTSGSVTVFGRAIDRTLRRRLGYVPQNLGLYKDLTSSENLRFRAAAYGVDSEALAGRTGPDDHAAPTPPTAIVGSLPLGDQRRLAFTAATMSDPELLILDEPTSGVSPLARSRLWDGIHRKADDGVGVLVSTHYIDEAEQADRLVILSRGRVVATGSVADIVADRATTAVDTERWAEAFRTLDHDGRPLRLSGRTIRVLGERPEHIAAELGAAGIHGRIRSTPATLEEVLIELDTPLVTGR